MWFFLLKLGWWEGSFPDSKPRSRHLEAGIPNMSLKHECPKNALEKGRVFGVGRPQEGAELRLVRQPNGRLRCQALSRADSDALHEPKFLAGQLPLWDPTLVGELKLYDLFLVVGLGQHQWDPIFGRRIHHPF